MTREEAVEVLKERYLTCVGIGLDNHANRVNEAFDMAIEALSAEAVSREEYEETDGVITIEKQSAKDVGEIKHIVIHSPNYTRYFYNESMPTSADAVSREEYEEVKAYMGTLVDAFIEDGEELAKHEWIPCSERLPKAEDMYQPPEQRYLCQLEAYGERKFCVLSRLKGAVSPFWDWYGVAVHDSEVTAWMPLPTPYKGGDDE